MTCGQCGADLIGSGKFCASCGAPKPSVAGDLSDKVPPAAANPVPQLEGGNLLVLPDIAASGPPSGGVNPFAATAPPGSALPRTSGPSDPLKVVSGAMSAKPVSIEAKSESIAPAPLSPRAVSPLAVSNGVSGRTPFQEAVEKARQSVAPAAQPKPKKTVGTQMMVNAPKRPGGKDAPADAGTPPSLEEPKKRAVPKTVAMTPAQHQASSGTPSASGGAAPQSVVAPGSGSGLGNAAPNSVIAPSGGGAGAAPQSVIAPSASGGAFGGAAPNSYIAAPGSVGGVGAGAPNSYIASQGYGAAPGSVAPGALGQHFQQQQPPMQPPHSAYGQRPPPQHHAPQPLAPYQQPAAPAYPPPQWGAPPPSYGFQYAPGSRVQVTWSNGQRYPATVSQINGPQCLVVFPDGQQHWVQLQYLTPG